MSSLTTAHGATFIDQSLQLSQIGNIWMQMFSQPSETDQTPQPSAESVAPLAKELPLRILLAEDQWGDRTVALRVLRSLGYQADVVGNGLEALEALRQNHYDVVLTDVQMPQMGGLAMMRRLCQEWLPEQRPCIIAVTSDEMPQVREECLKAGMNECLSKPLAVDKLVAALRMCQFCGDSCELD
ncbi:MAG: response regulator [Coleofasciculus sp. G3-WIS-01]|uniref:response regulator n=2 Tax=unclassified Coleofasciculus TaxID=2692782 RepID=UPI0032F960C7